MKSPIDHVVADDEFIAPADASLSLAEQAAHWVVQLSGDDPAACEAARRGFELWQNADPRHAEAAQRLQALISRMQQMRHSETTRRPAQAALEAAFAGSRGSSRKLRRAAVAALLVILLALPSWLLLRAFPAAYLLADLRTGTGQWQTRVLEDGTRITLNSASAVNLHYDSQRRVLQLVQGELLVEVATDPQRPFEVQTEQGRIRALGTRFVVSSGTRATLLSMLESRVAVRTAQQLAAGDGEVADATIVNAGQRVRITAQEVGPQQAIDTRSITDAWKYHQLVVQGQPLAQVLDTLNRYRPGLISYDREQIAGIHVAAVLPLDDIDRALQLLGHSFPQLRMRRFSPYLLRVDAPPQ